MNANELTGYNRDVHWLRRGLEAVNMVFFEGMLESVNIKWSRYRPVTKIEKFTYGSYLDNVIEISPVLAWYWVPDYVVMATIYHESLHHMVGMEHDLTFVLSEKRFPHHAEGLTWEARNWERLVKAANPFARKKDKT